jgi:hypothetical protein
MNQQWTTQVNEPFPTIDDSNMPIPFGYNVGDPIFSPQPDKNPASIHHARHVL